MNFQMIWLDLEKTTRDQIANIRSIIEKARVPGKLLLLLIDYAKAFDCVGCNKLWKVLQEMGIPDHVTCLLRNLYAGQEAAVITMDNGQWANSKLGKEYIKALYCHTAF